LKSLVSLRARRVVRRVSLRPSTVYSAGLICYPNATLARTRGPDALKPGSSGHWPVIDLRGHMRTICDSVSTEIINTRMNL